MTVEKSEAKPEVSLDDVLAKLTALETKAASLEAENQRLVAFNNKVIDEKKEKDRKHQEEVDRLEAEKLQAKTHTKEEAAALIQQYKDENSKLKADIEAGRQKEYQARVNDKAKELANQFAEKDAGRRDLLAEKIANQIKLDEDGNVVVLDEKKNPTISSVDALLGNITQKYKFLCDGLESSGGGSHSSAGAQQIVKLSEMTEDQKLKLYRTDISKYRELEKLED